MWRKVGFAASVIAAILVGVGGASAFIGNSGQDTAGGPQASQPDGNGASLVVSASDLVGETDPWAVRVYRSVTGLTCPEVGRTHDGDFGQVDGDGRFRPSSIQAAGSCIDLAKAPMSLIVNHYAANDDRGARAVVFGVVSPIVRNVEITIDGHSQALSITNGAFVSIASERELAGATVNATMTDGSNKSFTLTPSTFPAAEPPGQE
jgi:hypothetical protein